MNKFIPTITAVVIAGALALSGASAASAHPTTPPPEATSSSSTVTPPTNTSEPEPLSTTLPTASAASGQSSADPVSVPLTVKLSESESPTPEPSESPKSPASPPSEKPSKLPVVSTPDPVAVEVPQLVLWEKPANTFGPQHLIASTSTANLNALDADALPGHCYQADLYHPSETTSALIAGGVLNAPNSPHEELLAGGDGVAYKTWCVPVPVVPTPVVSIPVILAPDISTVSNSTTDCASRTVTTVTTTTTSKRFYVAGKIVFAVRNLVVITTVSRPATDIECPVLVVPPTTTPAVTAPAAAAPPAATVAAVVLPVKSVQSLAFTGQTPLAEATQLALALAGIILLIFGITMMIALRIRARRE